MSVDHTVLIGKTNNNKKINSNSASCTPLVLIEDVLTSRVLSYPPKKDLY